MNPESKNLFGLTQKELAVFFTEIGESPFRGRQMYQWLYARGVTDLGAMTDLGKGLREKLARATRIERLSPAASQTSSVDGTTKFLFRLHDGGTIESVLIPPARSFRGKEAAREEEQKRLTLCISTQVGCPLDCAFCATGKMGFSRNLSPGEIIGQVLEVKKLTGRRITNVVFMGMGEPMMNYDNVMKSVEVISTGIGVATRRITVSTAGWADKIRQMGEERRRVKLAVSLHSATDSTRTKLMPVTRKFPLAELISAIEYYYACTKQRVTYEYIFFEGVNDAPNDVARLIALARRVPCKINVIPFHSIAFTSPAGFAAGLRPSPRMETIVEELRASNLTVMVRSSAGEDIDAACGQLAVMATHKGRPAMSGATRRAGHPSTVRRSRAQVAP
jgi:23S rRNA (adenine2503-C2)-methyltransferase